MKQSPKKIVELFISEYFNRWSLYLFETGKHKDLKMVEDFEESMLEFMDDYFDFKKKKRSKK